MNNSNIVEAIVKSVSALILKHTIKIYHSSDDKKFTPYCTGVFYQNLKKTYILTAEHAFDHVDFGNLRVFHNGFFLYLEGIIISNSDMDVALFEVKEGSQSIVM
jgi:hypothetical protein